MNKEVFIDKNGISDPLTETGIPNICNLFDWHHHSPTQSVYPDGNFAYRYWFVPQSVRRQFEGNANMSAGVAINNAIAWSMQLKTASKEVGFSPLHKRWKLDLRRQSPNVSMSSISELRLSFWESNC